VLMGVADGVAPGAPGDPALVFAGRAAATARFDHSGETACGA
jgi:hypothetical protein